MAALPDAAAVRGDRLLHLRSVDSTMEEARRRWAAGETGRLWIVADEQKAGRGRQGRDWRSPPGNLHLTLLTPTGLPLRDQPKLGFAAGVALAVAVQALLPRAAVALKWPNDLLLGGAKAAGLLLEGLGQGAAIAIGIGCNVVAHPPDTPYAATHLAMAGPDLTRDMLFPRLVEALTAEIDRLADGSGFPLVRARWLALAGHLGAAITVRREQGALQGRFRGLDDDGRLLLETEAGLARIEAGDVFPLDKTSGAAQERALNPAQPAA